MDHDHGADTPEREPLAVPTPTEPELQPDVVPVANSVDAYVTDGAPADEPLEPLAPRSPAPEPAPAERVSGEVQDGSAAPVPPSWAWSTHGATTAETPIVEPDGAGAGEPVATAVVTDTAPSRREKRGARSALVGGIAGALVGALVAGGLLVAFDDDPESAPARTSVQSTTDGTARPATVVVDPGDIRSILEAARPAVVSIDVGGEGQVQGTGTGFIVDSSGVIVTNAHVVDGFDEVIVHTADGDELPGDVVGADTRLDLAVVQVDATDLPTLELGDSDALQVGDAVVAIGNALGLSEGSGATVTTGIISGLDRVVDVGQETLFNAIQTDAAINPGNSGGPLVDMNGRVIGINTAIASPETANNVGFAISISSAKPIIEDLREGREPQIAFLGVTTEPLTADRADELGVEQGAVVGEVSEGSAAEDAGIRAGDVIIEVSGTTIDSVDDVASEVRKHRPGDQIDVVIVRDGTEQTLTVTLGDRPDNF